MLHVAAFFVVGLSLSIHFILTTKLIPRVQAM